METIFWRWKGIFFKVLPQRETIDAAPDHQTLEKLRRALSDKRQGRNRSSCNTPTRSYLLRAKYSEERLGTSFPSTPHSGSSPIGLDLFGFVNNNRMRGKRWATSEEVQAAVRRCSRTAEMEFYGKWIFILLEWRQKCIDRDGDFAEKWILCRDLAGMWCFPINTFTGLPGWFPFMCTDRRLLSQKLFIYVYQA